MKFTKQTIGILENFSGVNPSIIFRKGSILRVGAPNMSVFCRAELDVQFEQQVGIYNMRKFLGVLSLFDGEPDVEFSEGKMLVSSGKQSVEYVLGDESLIKASPDKDPNVPEPVATFSVTAQDLSSAMKATSLLSLPTIAFVSVGGTVKMVGRDGANSSKDKYSVAVGSSTVDFDVPLPRTSFKMMGGIDYEVGVDADYASFSSPTLKYWLPRQIES